MDKYLKMAKIAYYIAMTLAGIADAAILGVFYIACTKGKKEESNGNTVESN